MTQVDDTRTREAPGGWILVADANPDAREYITRLLSHRWSITSVADGRAALQAAHEQSPDLIISDVNTPGLDGMGLLRTLRTDPLRARIPVVLVSTRVGDQSRIEALEAGADDYLVQPFSARELVARVESTIALARLREQGEAAARVSEERYRAFIEQSSEGVWRIELDQPVAVTLSADEQIDRFYAHGRLAECNDAMARMYGFEHASELVGTALADLVPRSDPANLAFLHAFIDANYRLYDAESHEIDRHGQARYFLNNFVGILDQGRLVRAWGTQRDVTDRKVAEERLLQAQRMEAVGRLAGGVAHEANNQMSVILGSVAFLLGRGDLPDEVREDVEQIQRAAERTASVTTQLLAFSRRQVLQIQWLDLNTTVAGMESTLRRTMGEEVTVVLRIQDVSGSIVADPGQLERALLNLALNARDAMPGGGRLTIETGTIVLTEAYARLKPGVAIQPGAYAVLAVSDTGHGMDRETLAQAFEPFFTTKGLGKGTGLGLSTVYGFVKQSDGYVWAYSEPGQGTVVKVYLPLVDLPTEAGAPARSIAPPAVIGRTVLVVEDEPQVRRMAARALAQAGHRVLEAADGRDAISLLARAGQGIDLVLTDVAMPGMSGRELAERLREARPDVRVIFMSGYADDEIVRRGLLDPEQPFIQKPFTPAVLVQRVAELTEQWLPASSPPIP
ncbi:MAG TPA: response regulator [Gemmatimonadales bacterium]|nr:response regulator [Gemmatimonadales bacterium]